MGDGVRREDAVGSVDGEWEIKGEKRSKKWDIG